MAAHRYWRINITSVDGGDRIGLSEVEFFDVTTGGTDLSEGLGANMSASSTSEGGAWDTVDNNNNSEWVTTSFPAWLKIDFGAGNDKEVKRFSLRTQRVLPNRTPKEFTIQWSDNNTDWTVASAYENQTGWTEFEKREFSVLPPTSVSGVIYDSAGSPASRTVRVYRRDTGALVGEDVSDGTTGAYTVGCGSFAGEAQRIVLDDDAGTLYNDLIDRVFPG